MTQCLACHQWSDHEDWYHDDEGLTVEAYIRQFDHVSEPSPEARQTNGPILSIITT
jgi:hypothetical protein